MHLFSPCLLGQLGVINRIALSAMPSGYALADGRVSSALTNYYLDRARGGVGLMVLEAATPLPPLDPLQPHLGLYDDEQVLAYRSCVAVIRETGCVLLSMLDSPISATALELSDLSHLVDRWVVAAQRARLAGADGVMLSCADQGLFEQLLSPVLNRRNDQYGGNSLGRARLLLEVVERLRQSDRAMAIGVRLNIGDFGVRGLAMRETRALARRLVAAGVDLLEVSSAPDGDVPIARFPGWLVPIASELRAVVSVPVMVGGLITEPMLANIIICEQSADLVAVNEVLQSDPRWPELAREILQLT